MDPSAPLRALRKLRVLFFLLAAATLLACAQPAHQTPPPSTAAPSIPAHLSDANLLLSQLRPEDTSYQHRPTILQFRDKEHAHAECRADCSGLITALLQHSYHLTEDDLKKAFGAARPFARHYVEAIDARRGFTPITNIKDARPGDIIAIRYPPGSSSGDDTGHVMILAAQPRPRQASAPLIDKTSQWDLDIIDSTGSPHTNDSRHEQGKDPHSGAGRGTFRVYTNGEGVIQGHAWSDSAKAAYRAQSERRLVVGRFEP